MRFDLRGLAVSAVLLLLIAVAGAVSLSSGKFPIPPADVMRALLGGADENIRMVVTEWRLPRLLLACLLGGALGLSGAIFQSLTRNPLGSPDIIGFSAGSYTGALIVILLFSGGYYQTAGGALAGGIATAACVYLLAYRRGAQGFRLIVIGIGMSAMLGAFNAWMVRQADLPAAMSAAIWGAGSLNGLSFEQVFPVVAMLVFITPILGALSRPLRQLELGDDAARTSGINATRLRLMLMILGVALTALATAAAGPISFISLAAPQIARRVTRKAGVDLIPSALMGALLLAVADWVAQHAFGVQLPVGVMTVSIGGFYFLWLLIREARR
ncbi:iron chelate uptake ABC transporter family permease subunit [Ensifer sp. HO-A22]|uniref:Iron chelate uptake ABC transporter family permease subunit n=1 Tax=Ensifer oleiphilus TaxID=2742698 RepID=A0A7Y6QCZ2_9HYPH|nr:iron chelate uptake ABC transporter family permease subunit [Ensifer oleiphilus]NVD43344.1 iron chelate uptake ABC transporter family permease subunit [Ensifer oleiphilus]